MSFRTRTPSIFRPKKPIDQSVLTQNRALIEAIDRRGVLRGAISLGALTLLTGCDVTEEEPVQKAMRAVSAWNDRVQAAIFRPDHLAPTFPAAQVVKPPAYLRGRLGLHRPMVRHEPEELPAARRRRSNG
jgi:hypothetical protein